MADFVRFTVYGKPAQKGSKKAFAIPGKNGGKPTARMLDDNDERKTHWHAAVADAAARAMAGRAPFKGPVRFIATFVFSRAASHFTKKTGKRSKKYLERHTQTPDLDKLMRLVGDAVTGICYADDRQIFDLTVTREWADDQNGSSRAEILIEEAD